MNYATYIFWLRVYINAISYVFDSFLYKLIWSCCCFSSAPVTQFTLSGYSRASVGAVVANPADYSIYCDLTVSLLIKHNYMEDKNIFCFANNKLWDLLHLLKWKCRSIIIYKYGPDMPTLVKQVVRVTLRIVQCLMESFILNTCSIQTTVTRGDRLQRLILPLRHGTKSL